MNTTKYIGRVGGLAVVLGVGTAIGLSPGLAWAEPDRSGDTTVSVDGASPPAEDAAPRETESDQQHSADTSGPDSTATDLDVDSVVPAVTTGSSSDSATGSSDAIPAPPDPGEPVDQDATEGSDPASAVDDAADSSDPAPAVDDAGADREPSAGSHTTIVDGGDKVNSDADDGTDAGVVALDGDPALSVTDRGPQRTALRSALFAAAAPAAVQSLPPGLSVDVEVSQPDSGPLTPAFAPIRAVVLRVLGVFGFSPDPDAPASNPLLEAAWGFYRRIESLVANDAPEPEGAASWTVVTDATGQQVLEGQLNFSDAEFDPLTYTVVDGDATVDQNGLVTLRMPAGGQPVTFTVAVSDGTHSLFGASDTTTATFSVTNADVMAPMVIVTAPSTVSSGAVVTVTASATDNVGVAGVRFFVDGLPLLGEDTETPYAAVWDTTTAAIGTHTLTAQARDAADNIAVSPPVNVVVAVDDTAPSVTLTTSATSVVAGALVTAAVSATDDVGLTEVRVLLDGAQLGAASTTSPFTVSWDTTGARAGAHTLTAEARDAAGNVGFVELDIAVAAGATALST